MKLTAVREVNLQTNKFISLCAAMLATALLTSCVTTTTGGFNVEASDEQALQDYVQLAIGYYDADDLIGARRHLNNALEINDRHADIYTVLALILQREGDLELAEENFRRAISLDRNNSRARNNYAVLLFSLERYRDAYDQLERVANDSGYEGRAIAFENLGRSALRLERLQDAEYAFERALQINGNLYVAALELARLKFDNQDWNGARQNYRQYLTNVEFYSIPHSPRALLAGIQIEGRFQNQEIVNNFSLILRTLYQDSPEYQAYQRLNNAH